MRPTTRLQSESSTPTLRFNFSRDEGVDSHAGTTPDPYVVICIDDHLLPREAPPGYTSISRVMERLQQTPGRLAAIQAARREVSGFLRDHRHEDTLKSFRLSQGLSQQEFALRLETTQPYVSRVEANPACAGLEFMRKLCTAFDIDMNQANKLLR